jgi:hypothetical protein
MNAKEGKNGKSIAALFFVLSILILLLASFANAAINETKQVEDAYKWLKQQVQQKGWAGLNTIQHEFTLLALAYDSNFKGSGLSTLKAKGLPAGKPVCFGDAGTCKIKETALASLVYNKLGIDNKALNEWLLNQSTTFKNIQWYLQIDVERGESANCSISYNDKTQNVTIFENKSLEVSSGGCLSAFQGYWTKISKDCYGYDFYITCAVRNGKPYKVNFLYKENDNDPKWYVSNVFYSLASGEEIMVNIKDFSKCLSDAGSCDYEANAIAAYVLKISGNEDYKGLLPFLKIMEKANENLNSYAWLYLITGDPSYASLVLNKMQKQGFWAWPLSKFGQFYDTAINAYAVKDSYEYNITKTKNYLLNAQKDNHWNCGVGCDEIRDTALILYVFWPKGIAMPSAIAATDCEAMGGQCANACEAGYIENPSLSPSCEALAFTKCCVKISSLSCESELLKGVFCKANEICEGQEVIAAEGKCCLGTCKPAANTCEQLGGYLCKNEDDAYCPFGSEIAASDAKEGVQCCSEYCKSCNEMDGKVCGKDEDCMGYKIGNCCIGECVTTKTCGEAGGQECRNYAWRCEGRMISASDADRCCIGNCIKRCEDYGGQICKKGESCKGGTQQAAVDLQEGQTCCLGGECKAASKAWIVVLVLLLIIALLGLGFYLVKSGKIKIKKKPPTAPAMPGAGIITPRAPAIPPGIPATPRPLPQFPLKPEKKPMPKTKEEEEFEKAMEKIRKLTKK